MADSVLQLKCSCNNYPWGKTGSSSLAASLCSKTPDTDFKIDESKPYAEMWMGTYPVLPSYVLSTGEDLQDVLDKRTDLIGEQVIKKFGHTKLPFLPKILSIAKALTLQVHPSKDLSARLHAKDPSSFTDPNHKPEIAIALSQFEAFCGWKPLADIQSLFDLQPLQRYKPAEQTHFNNETLKRIVAAILKDTEANTASVQTQLSQLPASAFGTQTHIPALLPRLQSQYDKTDPGILVALLTMNYLTLPPGSCIYIPADGIHAYLSGDIVECMARSNNVLNTGFCPRADRDSIDLFTSTLSFEPHRPEDAIVPAERFERGGGRTVVYKPPTSEFDVLVSELGKEEEEVVGGLGGPSVLISTRGDGVMSVEGREFELREGYIFFVGQGVETRFKSAKGMSVYRAYVE
ncbi:MAG: hypothetical protein M1828_005309 [Chrysothrix sp. TS-e1954]|nr:MAG: hypothetical protein M1828_005309 [Chrysothrix sp. TS-e1954]